MTETPLQAGGNTVEFVAPRTEEEYSIHAARLPRRRALGLTAADGRFVNAHVLVAFVALLLGGIAGLLQALEHSGRMDIPFGLGYYQLVTAHGILMALVFTTFFIVAFLHAGMAVTLDGEMLAGARGLAWSGFWAMVTGCVLVVVPLLAGEASVLYTFYAPMQAHPAFYIGLTLVVIGSWMSGAGMFVQYADWRRRNEVAVSPLFSFMAIATMLVWQVATLGVAAEMLTQLIPWSLGWLDTVNVLLTRTLFWFFGHPLVYFWLMPAYIAWYLVMPKLIGGKVFSDNLARMSFLLLLLFSIPVGVHHQLMEPGIDEGFKFLQVGLTLAVVIPSLMTAFALFATMERAGRARGFGGLFGWVRGLPWGDARFTALFVGMFTFIPGGAGGIILASYNLNQVVHNTIYVTGHFHLTVATAVAETFIGTAFWLVPHAAGRRITARANRWMFAQIGTWAIGMTVMSGAMHIAGLLGAPRRTKLIDYGSSEPVASSWAPYQFAMAVGGTVLFVSVIIAFVLIAYLMFRAPRGNDDAPRAEFPLADAPDEGAPVPRWLERWRIWAGVLVLLIVFGYGGPIVNIIRHPAPGAKGVTSFRGDEGGMKMPKQVKAAAGEPVPTTTEPAAGIAGTMVDIELGEDGGKLYLKAAPASAPSGKVTFAVRNVGAMPHMFVLLKTDIPAGDLPDGDGGTAKEVGRLGAVPELAPGADTQYLTFENLEPGKYVLLCNVAGHYGLGQYAAFQIS